MDEIIKDLIGRMGPFPEDELIGEIITTALKLIKDGADRGDIKIINSALKEMRHAFNVFADHRGIRKVSVFGSARVEEDSPEFEQAKAFSRLMAENGFMVITGAGGGVMQGANEGAGRKMSFGLNIRLPHEQEANPVVMGDRKLIRFKYFFTRKLLFAKEADALALFPGGYGTHDEAFELLTLIQTGRAAPIPVVMIDIPGGCYWKNFKEYLLENMLRRSLIDEEDVEIFRIFDSPTEACREILHFYSNYHSMRYVDGTLVMRLQREPGEHLLAQLREKFSDLLAEGDFIVCCAYPQEETEPELAHLPRLAFKPNHDRPARLRKFIDLLNDAG